MKEHPIEMDDSRFMRLYLVVEKKGLCFMILEGKPHLEKTSFMFQISKQHSHVGSVCMVYMDPHLPSIYPQC